MAVVLAENIHAQTLLSSNLYVKNRYSINSAYAGSEGQLFASFQASNQVTTVEGAPRYLFFNVHALVADNLGVGLNVVQDKRGLFESTIVEMSSAYRASFASDHSITFGLSAGVLRERLDIESININSYVDVTDPVLQSDFYDNSQFKLGSGWLYQFKDFELSMSFPRLVRTNSKMNFDLMTYGAYNFYSNNGKWMYKPSVLYQAPDGNENLLDGNFMAEYVGKFWGQVGYRSNGSVLAGVGARVDFVEVGYSFGFATGDLNEFMTGKHEVLVSLSFGRRGYSKGGENYTRTWQKSENKKKISGNAGSDSENDAYVKLKQEYDELEKKMREQEARLKKSESEKMLLEINKQLVELRNDMAGLKSDLENVVVENDVKGLDSNMSPGYYVVVSTCQDVDCARLEQQRFSGEYRLDTEVAINSKKGFYYIITHQIDDFDQSVDTMKDMRKKGHADAWVLVYK